ncbi:hypothetical protein DPMN_105037 [Dreissena polymorpha]|uniref:Uncharacterized protein n=2 Tax=Dreissena polymorpha TaxID=45954 RepID=A0A9D4HGB3_DREPO|nr:hypothetical protein DPMN_105037 [Dreissena polymorpha]
MVKGGQVHSDKQVESDVTITYHPKKTVGFGVRYHNQSARYAFYSGGLTITLPEERQMMFAGEFGRKEENRYISNLEFEVIKGRRTKINTILKVATNQMYEVELGLSLPDLEPVRVIGAYNQRDKGYSGEAFFKKGDKTYRILGEVKHEVSKVTSVMLDVTVPTRRVKFITAMEKLDSEHHYLLDVQWNVDVNMDERFLTNITYDVKSVDDFEISTTLHYPSRTIDFTIKHNTADRYITNIELAWSPEEKIKFYIIFRNDVYNGADRRELDVGFESPFKQYEELSLSISAISNDKQVQTKSKVVWGSKQKVLVSMTVKLPLTKQTADIVGTVTTPFDGFETMTLNLKHRMSDRLESSASAEWGRKRFSINTRGNVIINPLSRRFNGSLEIRTPFETLRVLTVRGLHQDDNKKFRSSFKIEIQNSTGLSTVDIGMDADHSYSKVLGLMNKGTFTVTAPGENITTVWEVSQLSGSTKALLDIQPMRGNRFKLEIGETHSLLLTGNKISSKFELLIPTENLRQFVVTFNHEDRPGFVSTVGGVTKDNLEIMAANVKFQKSATYLGLDVLITSIYSENLIFKVSSVHSIMPYRANLELSWGETPYKILADSNVFFNDFGLHDYKITITTPIQGARSIVLTEKRQRNGLKWETNTKITVDQQSVTCSVLYRYDHEKFTQISLSSSFPQFPGLTAVMRLDGMETNFNGDASFQMAPYVGKISTDFKWLYYEGSRISGSVNLNTPFPTYPYMKSKFDSDVMGVSRVSTLEVEYLPTQVIKAILDHRFTSLETLEGTLKVTSPFTENKEVVAGFTHVGTMKDFKTNAKITCDCITRPVFTEAIFSLKNGVISKFVMESPFRGYETC